MPRKTQAQSKAPSAPAPAGPIQGKQAYSVHELARTLSLSTGFLRNEIKTGELKPTKFGRRILIMQKDLDAYIANKADA